VFKSVEELAALIDFTMLRPDLTEQQVIENCQYARQAGFASVTVRPSDIDAAVRALADSSTRPGTVAGFPHGDSTTATKLYEVRELLRRGAREIDAVVNIAKLLSRQFQYVESEIQQISESCRKEGGVSKVIFENCYLSDELKIILCRICSRAEVNLVVTSTNFSPGGYAHWKRRFPWWKTAARVLV
jgi:deoxyribose-phosphate aldolase